MADYPARFDISRPERFDRTHVFIRLLIIVIVWGLAGSVSWVVYLGVPVLAAILISQKGPVRYLAEADGTITLWLRYIVAFYAYLALLTDKLPNESMADYLRFEVAPNGSPSAGNALVRIILGIPSLIVLALLWIAGVLLGLIAAIMILAQESYPEAIYAFLRGLLRWQARLLAYMASLVEQYPPFAFDTDEETAAAAPS